VVRVGAAEAAPTAPHATPPERGPGKKRAKRTGPERFWSTRGKWIAFAVCLAVSFGVHYVLSPLALLPAGGFDVKDPAGARATPVALTHEAPPAPPPPPPPPPAPAPPPKASDTPGIGAHAEAGAPRKRDAGAPRARDAEVTEDAEVEIASALDAGIVD